MRRPRTARGETLFAAAVTVGFVVAAGLAAFWHEMWRDELRAWLIARDSATPGAVLENIGCEGHPSLWYLLLWPVVRVVRDPDAMKLLNVSLMAGAVFLGARFAPAPRLIRALAAFGYFPVYEYGAISRNYAMGVLGLVAFCALFPQRRRHPLALGLVLFLTAHTSLVACVLALAAALAVAAEALGSPERASAAPPGSAAEEPPVPAAAGEEQRLEVAGPRGWAGIALALAGVATSALQMRPSGRCAYWFAMEHGWVDLGGAFGAIPVAFLPVLRSGAGYWGIPLVKAGGLALLVIPWCSLALCRRRVAWLYYFAATMGLIAFFFATYSGARRHHGFLFVAFATAAWIAHYVPPRALPRRLDALARGAERWLWRLAPAALFVHVFAAGVAVAGERRYVFSGSRGAAAIMKSHGLDGRPIVCDTDEPASGVLAWLDRDRAFFPAGVRWASYPPYDAARLRPYDLWREVEDLGARLRAPLTVVLNHAPGASAPGPDRLVLVECQEADVRRADESLCVYEYRPEAGHPP